MGEQVFFSHTGITVTSSRFVSGPQTFVMGNVTSVKVTEKKPRRLYPLFFLLWGLATIVPSPPVGVAICAASIAYLIFRKTDYRIILATAGGEVSALKTQDRELLDNIVEALNQAIIQRG